MPRSVLTLGRTLRHGGGPLTVQGISDAFRVPNTQEKSGLFCFCKPSRQWSTLWPGLHIGGTTSGIREDRRPCTGRGASSRLFLCLQTLKQCRYPMTSISLSRPASHGPELTAALAALLGSTLPASCRVSWLILGNVLTVEEVRHA